MRDHLCCPNASSMCSVHAGIAAGKCGSACLGWGIWLRCRCHRGDGRLTSLIVDGGDCVLVLGEVLRGDRIVNTPYVVSSLFAGAVNVLKIVCFANLIFMALWIVSYIYILLIFVFTPFSLGVIAIYIYNIAMFNFERRKSMF